MGTHIGHASPVNLILDYSCQRIRLLSIFFDEGSMSGNKEISMKNTRKRSMPNLMQTHSCDVCQRIEESCVCFALFCQLIIDVDCFYSHCALHQRIIINCGEGKRSLIFAESLLIPRQKLVKIRVLAENKVCTKNLIQCYDLISVPLYVLFFKGYDKQHNIKSIVKMLLCSKVW